MRALAGFPSLPPVGPATSFTDNFTGAQVPIGSPWVRTSTVNQRVVVDAAGFATNDAQNSNNDDAYAYVPTATFKAPNDDYQIEATVYEPGGSAAMEIELLGRVTDNSSQYFGYELLFNGNGYLIVRIDGGFGGNYLIFDGNNGTPNTNGTLAAWTGTGDKVRFRITGTNPVRLQMSHAPAATPTVFTDYLDVNDSSALRRQTGQPAVGFYAANSGAQGGRGWSDFSVVAV